MRGAVYAGKGEILIQGDKDMLYLIVGICVVGVASIAAFLIYRTKRREALGWTDQNGQELAKLTTKQTDRSSSQDHDLDALIIPIEQFPAEVIARMCS